MDFEKYNISAFAYWNRSRELLNEFEQSRHKLFYSAYELRCAIESFLYDYLYFLRDGQFSKSLKKLYLAEHLKNAIRELEPDFEQRIAFNNLIHLAMGLDVVNIPVPDLDRLGELYGRIGAFMHVQKEAVDTNGSDTRWAELEQLVKDTQTFMHDLVHPQKSRVELTPAGVALFEDFKRGTKSPDQIKTIVQANIKSYLSRSQFHL
jgi:hypothetical protein